MAKEVTVSLGQEILLTFIWYKKGPILEHDKDKGQTVHSATYSAVCKEKLKLTFTTKEDDCYKNCSLAPQQWSPSCHSRNYRENMKPQV
jgi:hypothetical protein